MENYRNYYNKCPNCQEYYTDNYCENCGYSEKIIKELIKKK